MGRSEMLTGGRRKTALLGDAMEAVIAAVYLDGGLEAARALILRALGRAHRRGARRSARDAKTALQEWAQARGLPPPAYRRPRPRGAGPRAALLGRGPARGRPRGARAGGLEARRPAGAPPRRCWRRLEAEA